MSHLFELLQGVDELGNDYNLAHKGIFWHQKHKTQNKNREAVTLKLRLSVFFEDPLSITAPLCFSW
jgi:hypothetical protein